MAYNKSKHVDAAQKYLHQGKVPQAIAEYQSILKQEPKDQVTLMTIGDLYVRQGDTFRGLEYFERLAQIFLQDGFTTKAIAIYKKVAKLAPEESKPQERLAELYVQQGVLSEARPIFLQLAEMNLKTGKQPQAAALLKRLLEAEPDNLRVQVRLAELYLSMDQQKDALEMFLGAAQHVLDRGDQVEAVRLTERILQLDPQNKPALMLKIQGLSAAGKSAEAIALLEPLSKRQPEGETVQLLFEQYLASSQTEKATSLAEQMFARDSKNFAPAHQITTVLLESRNFAGAQRLLNLIRDAMAESNEQELARSLAQLADGLPNQTEPIEWLVELYAKKNDTPRLSGTLLRLARAYASGGNSAKALETYEQLLNRTPMDPTAQQEYASLRSAAGLEPTGQGSASTPPPPSPIIFKPTAVPVPSVLPVYDEETERYVMQALTDVDLFSSYGLTQKAIDLLEDVLRRAPHHVTALERLLDLSLGAGNDQRTVDVASTLEQLSLGVGDESAAERYAELRRRFQRASGGSTPTPVVQEPVAPSTPPAASSPLEIAVTPAGSATPEFAVPAIDGEPAEVLPLEDTAPEPAAVESMKAPPLEAVVHEVDLSQEWAALSQQIEEGAPLEAPADLGVDVADEAAAETIALGSPGASESPAPEPVLDTEETYELELQPEAPAPNGTPAPAEAGISADDLFSDLAHELESATASLHKDMEQAAAKSHPAPQAQQAPSSPVKEPAEIAAVNGKATNGASSGPLGDLFDEFRSEMGDSNPEQEDPETHYNLGIAYREMGLLDEAIGEFQKVYKGDKTQAFRYAMQCCTLLALAFREKGQPAIAAMWYERALLTPGLDQESVLALRYDLGVAQEMAGDTAAAFKSFSQVYAMNIDYRDVAERVALLGKAR